MARAPSLAQRSKKNEFVLKKRRTESVTKPLDSKVTELKLISNFERPAKRQNRSPLLCLAAELRVKILRNLLKSDGVIESQHGISGDSDLSNDPKELASMAEMRRGQRMLSSQILRSCQGLYAEGRHILYQENKLSLCITPQSCRILDQYISIPARAMELDDQKQDILSMAAKHKSLQAFLKMYSVISEFNSLSVIIHTASHKDLYVKCRLFRSLFHGKNITLSFTQVPRQIESIYSWVNACRIFRCKEIQFPTLSDDAVRSLRQLIMSDSNVVDQFDLLKECKMLGRISHAKRSRVYSHASDCCSRLTEACMNYTAVEVIDLKPNFSFDARKMIGGTLRTRRNVLRAKIEELESELDKLDEQEAKLRAALPSLRE